MKLFNIFKKEAKTIAKSNVQTLDKNQLNKVIGGGDGGTTLNETTGAINTTRSNIRTPTIA
jgi:bacteriocin-like protein